MNKTELKKTVTKIKKFLKERDYAAIDAGIELARGLNSPEVFEVLLKDCAVGKRSVDRGRTGTGRGRRPSHMERVRAAQGAQLIRSKMFTGSGLAQPFLDYALLKLIAYAPVDTEKHESLQRFEITSFTLGDTGLPSSACLGEFENLTTLELSCCAVEDVDGLAKNTRITEIDLSYNGALRNVDGLRGCAQLASLNLRECGALQNVDGLTDLTELSDLDLQSCSSLVNVDGLKNTTQLTSLKMNGCSSLKNVDGLMRCTQLTDLDLWYCGELENVAGLAGCVELTNLRLNGMYNSFGNYPPHALENVDGLANLTKLTRLDLNWCSSLKNVDALADLTQLCDLNLSDCKAVVPQPPQGKMTTREEVAAYQELIKSTMA